MVRPISSKKVSAHDAHNQRLRAALPAERNAVETTTPTSGTVTGGATTHAVNAKIDSAATAAHRATDAVSDTATAQLDKLSGSAHSAIDSSDAGTKSLADSASTFSQQSMQLHSQLKESACASIRANPLATLTGALVVGYLVGRIARL
jgi:hypothetical protein